MKKIIYLCGFLALVSSCKKEVDDETASPTTPPASSSNPYFSASLNGASWSYTSPEAHNGMGHSLSVDWENDEMEIDYSADFMELGPDFLPVNGSISVGYSGFHGQPSQYGPAAFHASMASVPQSFYAEGSQNPGFEVSYYDNDGNFWSTRYGSQSGSTVSMNTNAEGPVYMNRASRRFKGTASCKLYNMDNPSEFVTLSNGSFHFLLYEYEM